MTGIEPSSSISQAVAPVPDFPPAPRPDTFSKATFACLGPAERDIWKRAEQEARRPPNTFFDKLLDKPKTTRLWTGTGRLSAHPTTGRLRPICRYIGP